MYDSIAQDSHVNIQKYVRHICCLICTKYTFALLSFNHGSMSCNYTHTYTHQRALSSSLQSSQVSKTKYYLGFKKE